ncbi:protein ACCELERATED CELL DEATH 6-like [Cucurbita pepo subsp. pepo]|uniref:protein ACCELERATED CELL DEATH 6-like n=1 Tax=Cucurbita pepo subsp. pepo TaxID=3664 RepID=UPI000C9D27B2|nr:protein ACCELERATED CELL DEATH 6-like [Cucurbita pepo subsp. pepo]
MEANGENDELKLAISSFEEILHHHLEFTRFLLNLVPELAGEVDDLQRTPLHLASENGTVEIVQALLEKNTSTCMVLDLNGLLPLHHAVINGRIDIIPLLINARPRSPWIKIHNGQSVLHLCIKHNHLEALKLLITMIEDPQDYGFLNKGDENENTILNFSMMLRRIEIVQYLLSISGIKIGTNTANNCATSNEKGSPSKIEEQCDKKPSISLTLKKFIRSLWMKNLEYKGDWFQEVQGTMMLVATVIATVAFQGAINPPGGVWQEDIPFHSNSTIHLLFHSSNTLKTLIAGTAYVLTPSVCVATPKRITGRASLRYWFNDPCVARYWFERYNDPCVAANVFNDPCVGRYWFERYNDPCVAANVFNDPCVARYWFERYNDPCVAANVIVKLFSLSFLKSFFSIRARFQY